MDTQVAGASAPQPRKTNGKRNKNAGSAWEYACRDLLKSLGFIHVVTTRSESKSRDKNIIDLINKDEWKNGRLPYNVQCKNSSSLINYDRIFNGYTKTTMLKNGQVVKVKVPPMERVSGIINVILHKFTSNKGEDNKSGMFIPKGKYAILPMDDFITMVKDRMHMEVLQHKLQVAEQRLATLQPTDDSTD